MLSHAKPKPRHLRPRHPQSRSTRGSDTSGQMACVDPNPHLVDLDLDLAFDNELALGLLPGLAQDSEQFHGHVQTRYTHHQHCRGAASRIVRSRSRDTTWPSSIGGVPPVAPEVLRELEQPLKRQRSNRSARSTTSSARRRQNEDGCVTCLRGMLHCYNVFILIVGCAALGVGIWLLVTDFGARKVTPIVGNQLYEVTTYLLMAGGGAVALLAFCGCCGTIREDKCVLSFYGTTLAIVLIVLGASCGLAIFFRTEVESNIQLRMRNTLTKHYGVELTRNSQNRRITEAWDAMQRQLKCCGVAGNVTGSDSFQMYKSIRWSKFKKNQHRVVPESCCAPGDIKICTGEEEFHGPPIYFNAYTPDLKKTNPYLYTDGCYDGLLKYLKTYSTVVAGVSAIVPLFLIFGIVISFCLCARVTGYSTDDEVDL
ncbi:tetraspanin [Elysia marginata]|uniref:Tetraspanin n=1 Tax=Elysia marginata TaxID=1093978 RepID=A0AAV4IPS8_9GAST|nr:tetraspanin [Elysia marginata]